MAVEVGVVSPAFLIIALATPLLLRWRLPGLGRRDLLLVASLAFCVVVLPGVLGAVALLTLVVSGLVLVRLVARHQDLRLLWAAVAVILFEFWLFRYALPGSSRASIVGPLPTLGLSYVMFRVIHMIVDAQGGELPARIAFRDHVLYLLFYPAFLAGPIQRFQDFSALLAQVDQPRSTTEHQGAARQIANGAFRHVILAALFFQLFLSLERAAGIGSSAATMPLRLAVCWLSFAAYLYFSFAGYSEMMRGFARLARLDLPDNFDHPFAARNFLDFWSRWHITLSDWFKLYVFNPFLKVAVQHARTPRQIPYLGAAGYLLTFLLMGLWHGLTPRFALYGLVLGLGTGANKLFQTLAARQLGKERYRALTRSPAYCRTAQALAVAYFILALGFFWIPADARLEGDASASALAWVAGAILVLAAILSLVLLLDRAAAVLPALPRLFDEAETQPFTVAMLQLAAVLVYLLALGGTVPPLLYEFF